MTALDGWSAPGTGPDVGSVGSVTVEPAGVEIRYRRWTAGQLRSLCAELRRSREAVLAERPALEIADSVGRVGARFLADGDPLRERALELLPSFSGVSPEMAREILDGMARDWTAARLRSLLRLELGDPACLDGFLPDRRGVPGARDGSGAPAGGGEVGTKGHGGVGAGAEERSADGVARAGASGGRTMAVGPVLTFHVCASTVPGVSVTSLIRALLVKSASLVKPGRGDVVLPLLFREGLLEEDPELARCVVVSYWPGEEEAGEVEVLSEEADAVVVYGSDATVRHHRDRTPVTRRFLGYRHRVGVGLVARGRLAAARAGGTAERMARAVAVFDQRGCVSPHVLYVERGGEVDPGDWADALAEALGRLEEELPSGPLTGAEASEIQQLRGVAELRQAAGEPISIRHGGAAPWTVLVDREPGFRPSCTGRVVRIRPVEELEDAVAELAVVGRHLQTACLASSEPRRREIAVALARSGVLRITPPEGTPWPPPWWHHDGRGPLDALIRWVDLENPDPEGSGGQERVEEVT